MNTTLRRLAASTAVALAFGPVASAAGLLDDGPATLRYRGGFSEALAQAAGEMSGPDTVTRTRARGFMVELEKALKEPSEKTRTVVYPKENSTNMLVVAAVVPPKGFEALPIPVCAQQHNKVIGTWNITSKGEVQPVTWKGATTGEVIPNVGVKPACNAFIVAARTDINQRLAQMQQQQPGDAVPAPAPTGR